MKLDDNNTYLSLFLYNKDILHCNCAVTEILNFMTVTFVFQNPTIKIKTQRQNPKFPEVK